jgi:hypothetical protein
MSLPGVDELLRWVESVEIDTHSSLLSIEDADSPSKPKKRLKGDRFLQNREEDPDDDLLNRASAETAAAEEEVNSEPNFVKSFLTERGLSFMLAKNKEASTSSDAETYILS